MDITYDPAKRASQAATNLAKTDGPKGSRPDLRAMTYDDQVASLSPDNQNVQMEENDGTSGPAAKIRKKLEALFEKLGGPKPAFETYSSDGTLDGMVDIKAVNRLLKDAGVGGFMRAMAKGAILDRFDLDASGAVNWAEFAEVLEIAEEVDEEHGASPQAVESEAAESEAAESESEETTSGLPYGRW